MPVLVSNLGMPLDGDERAVIQAALARAGVKEDEVSGVEIVRKSLDRRRGRLGFSYTLRIALLDESAGPGPHPGRSVGAAGRGGGAAGDSRRRRAARGAARRDRLRPGRAVRGADPRAPRAQARDPRARRRDERPRDEDPRPEPRRRPRSGVQLPLRRGRRRDLERRKADVPQQGPAEPPGAARIRTAQRARFDHVRLPPAPRLGPHPRGHGTHPPGDPVARRRVPVPLPRHAGRARRARERSWWRPRRATSPPGPSSWRRGIRRASSCASFTGTASRWSGSRSSSATASSIPRSSSIARSGVRPRETRGSDTRTTSSSRTSAESRSSRSACARAARSSPRCRTWRT